MNSEIELESRLNAIRGSIKDLEDVLRQNLKQVDQGALQEKVQDLWMKEWIAQSALRFERAWIKSYPTSRLNTYNKEDEEPPYYLDYI